jgi:hypothetical protein
MDQTSTAPFSNNVPQPASTLGMPRSYFSPSMFSNAASPSTPTSQAGSALNGPNTHPMSSKTKLAPFNPSNGSIPPSLPPREWRSGPPTTIINQSSFTSSPTQESPTHVVGSQGRRGILPSAPGRPAVSSSTASSSGKNAPVPVKDANGKFPCPHCNKTYLHAKHLKRHLLRRKGIESRKEL